jgi:hypothetical protein
MKVTEFARSKLILWHTNGGSIITFPVGGAHVQAGTLTATDVSFSFLLGNAPHTTVEAGASIDLAAFSTNISDLLGGAVIDSGAAATLTLGEANFSGTISGPLSLLFNGATRR